jgi:NAD+ synthase (glutamine-hydrolysing)
LAGEKLDLVLNLSASPFHVQKPARRVELFQEMTRALRAPVAVCNMVGGNDELLFDGCSLVISRSGKVVAAGKAFEEDLLIVDAQTPPLSKMPWPESEPEWLYRALTMGLKDYVRKSGASRVCLGLSGGIDSSVCASLAAAALGGDAVAGLSLPTRFTSGPSEEDARTLAENLGISFREISIEPLFKGYEALLDKLFEKEPASLTLENIQPRIRMAVLMAVANEENRFLLNTSNKSEIACGYATLYGDAAGALAVLGDLTKHQVYQLAEYINRNGPVIPTRVIQRAPTAELRENQTDQDTLPPYEVLDLMVAQAVEQSRGPADLIQGGFQEAMVRHFQKLFAASEYKRRQLPPVLRVSSRAFGMGWRIPLAARKAD